MASAKDMVQTWWQHRRIVRLNFLRLQTVCIRVDTLPRFFGIELHKNSWSEVCREAVGAILSGLNLGQWQDSVMKQSLQDLKMQFRVVPGQPGFFSQPQSPDRAQEATYEQRFLRKCHMKLPD